MPEERDPLEVFQDRPRSLTVVVMDEEGPWPVGMMAKTAAKWREFYERTPMLKNPHGLGPGNCSCPLCTPVVS